MSLGSGENPPRSCDSQTDLDEAEARVKANPDNPDDWLRLGQAYNSLGRLSEAADAFRKAVELRPDYANAIAALAIALINAGQAADALTLAREAVRLAPNEANVHSVLSFALNNLRRFTEALQEADSALRLNLDDRLAHVLRSDALASLGRGTEAVDSARLALEKYPNDPGVVTVLAKAALVAKQYSEAEAAAKRLLALRPSSTEGLQILGLALAQQGAFRDAEASFRRGLELVGDEAELLNGLAYTLAKQGRYPEAAPAARRSVSLKDSWHALGTLAAILAGLGDAYKDKELYAEARDVASRAIRIVVPGQTDPDEEGRLYLHRGYSEARMGESGSAKGDFRIAVLQARPLSDVSLAAGRNLSRLASSSWEAQPAPRWLAHVILVAAAWLLLTAPVLITRGILDSAGYAVISPASFVVLLAAYSLPSLTRLKVGVVEFERTAAPLPIPPLEFPV